MRVFLSSVISDFEDFREAAAEGIESLGFEVVRAEDAPALPETPRRACLELGRSADALVLVLGSRYGAVQESGLSATHEEYRELRGERPVLAFVQDGVAREESQQEFIDEVEAWTDGALRSGFHDPASLQRAVTRALHTLELSQVQGAPDADEMWFRARALLGTESNPPEPLLVVAVAGGPRQNILRPAEIESPDLVRWLRQTLLFGPHGIFDEREGSEDRTDGQAVELVQAHRAGLRLDAEGSLRLAQPLRRRDDDGLTAGFALIEEDVTEALVRSLQLSAQILDHVDPNGKLSRIAIGAETPGAGYMGWQTRAKAAASGGSVRVAMFASDEPIHLSPPDRARAALRLDAHAIAQDLTILLRQARG